MASKSKFIQITATSRHQLYALDDEGRVWHYIPAHENPDGTVIYSFWSKLTDYRRDPANDG